MAVGSPVGQQCICWAWAQSRPCCAYGMCVQAVIARTVRGLECLQCSVKLDYCFNFMCVVVAACAARPRTVGEPLSDAEAYAMAADASMDLEGMAVGSVWADVASEKKCSLYCNGKKVTPEEDAVQLGSNKTQVPLCVLAYMLHGPWSHPPCRGVGSVSWSQAVLTITSCAGSFLLCPGKFAPQSSTVQRTAIASSL